MPEQGRDGETIERRAWVTDDQVGRLVALLRDEAVRRAEGDEPRRLPAGRIADRLRLFPDAQRETRRRRVRELVDAARVAGHPIIADGLGLWLAATAGEIRQYHDWRRKFGLADLVAVSRIVQSPTAHELAGQRSLF